jgi:hypothetical protein
MDTRRGAARPPFVQKRLPRPRHICDPSIVGARRPADGRLRRDEVRWRIFWEA